MKKTIEQSNLDKNFKSSKIIFFFQEKSIKISFSENPLTEIADVTADGPGIGIIFISFLKHSLINILPGSDTRSPSI